MRRTLSGAIIASALLLAASAYDRPGSASEEPRNFTNCTNMSNPACVAEKEHVHIVQVYAQWYILPFAAVFMTATSWGVFVHHRMHRCCGWLPESALVVFFGAGLSFVVKLFDTYLVPSHHYQLTVESYAEVFSLFLNLILLPIIIFTGGWTLRKKDFASQITPIMIFAICGTLISFVIVGLGIYFTGLWGWHPIVDLRLALAYSSLISAVDPVASLATYSALSVEPLLNILVFGESTINDAVAISIFVVLNDSTIMDANGRKDVGWVIFLQVLFKLFGSALLGIVLSMFYIISLRVAHLKEAPSGEIMFIFASAFLTFAVAEGPCHLSGIIAVLFSGMFMGVYCPPHLSKEGTLLTSFYLKMSSSMADMMVFLLVGWVVVYGKFEHWGLTGALMLLCIIARACAIFPVGALVNGIKALQGKYRDTPKEDWHMVSAGRLFMMWWAGLRGGIALVLVLELGPWVDPVQKEALRDATFVLIIVFLLVFGGTTEFFLQFFRIPCGGKADQDILLRTEASMGEIGALQWLHQQVFVPLLIGRKLYEETKDDQDVPAEDIDLLKLLKETSLTHGYNIKAKRDAAGDEWEDEDEDDEDEGDEEEGL